MNDARKTRPLSDRLGQAFGITLAALFLALVAAGVVWVWTLVL